MKVSGSMLKTHDHYPGACPESDEIGRRGLDMPGRFFGVDPLAEEFATWSPYVYTYNNPVNWRDPDGRSACCGTLQGSLRFAMGRDQTYLGTLARADSRGQLDAQVRTDAINVGVAALDKGIHVADAVSTGAGIVASGSVMLSGATGGASLTALAPSMAVNFSADLASVALTAAKESMLGSGFQATIDKSTTFIAGEVTTRVFGLRVGALLGPMLSPAYQLIQSESDEQNQSMDRPIAPADNTRVTIRPEVEK